MRMTSRGLFEKIVDGSQAKVFKAVLDSLADLKYALRDKPGHGSPLVVFYLPEKPGDEEAIRWIVVIQRESADNPDSKCKVFFAFGSKERKLVDEIREQMRKHL